MSNEVQNLELLGQKLKQLSDIINKLVKENDSLRESLANQESKNKSKTDDLTNNNKDVLRLRLTRLLSKIDKLEQMIQSSS